MRRKILRARDFLRHTQYEYSEFVESTFTIIFIKPHINIIKIPENYEEIVEINLFHNDFKIKQIWISPIKITRFNSGFTFKITKANKTRVRNSQFYLGPRLWNLLPNVIRNECKTKEQFKTEILSLFQIGYFDSVVNGGLIK